MSTRHSHCQSIKDVYITSREYVHIACLYIVHAINRYISLVLTVVLKHNYHRQLYIFSPRTSNLENESILFCQRDLKIRETSRRMYHKGRCLFLPK